MDKLEFYDRYQLYSTADLIKIVWERDGYQPAAELQPYKWYRIFLVVYGSLFGWELLDSSGI